MNTPTIASPIRTSESTYPKFTAHLPCAAIKCQPFCLLIAPADGCVRDRAVRFASAQTNSESAPVQNTCSPHLRRACASDCNDSVDYDGIFHSGIGITPTDFPALKARLILVFLWAKLGSIRTRRGSDAIKSVAHDGHVVHRNHVVPDLRRETSNRPEENGTPVPAFEKTRDYRVRQRGWLALMRTGAVIPRGRLECW